MVILRAKYQSEGETIQAYAVDASRAATMYPDYGIAPKVLEQFATDRTAAIAGKLLIRNHGWKIGDTITLRGDSNRLKIRFVLLGETPSNNYPNFFMFRRDYLVESEKAIGVPEIKHPAGLLVTRVRSRDDLAAVIHEVDSAFHNSDFETVTISESDAISGLLSTVADVRTIVYSIFLIILLTILLIAANSMSMMVRDRLQDVAIMRALGFGPRYVTSILLAECLGLGAAGGAAGSLAAYLLFAGGTTIGAIIGNAGALTITLSEAGFALLVSIAVSVLAGIWPILGTIRVTPMDALRRVN
jgi:putative ABC transport system permease protein